MWTALEHGPRQRVSQTAGLEPMQLRPLYREPERLVRRLMVPQRTALLEPAPAVREP